MAARAMVQSCGSWLRALTKVRLGDFSRQRSVLRSVFARSNAIARLHGGAPLYSLKWQSKRSLTCCSRHRCVRAPAVIICAPVPMPGEERSHWGRRTARRLRHPAAGLSSVHAEHRYGACAAAMCWCILAHTESACAFVSVRVRAVLSVLCICYRFGITQGFSSGGTPRNRAHLPRSGGNTPAT